jgi:linoleoyl-CoA desaturase
MSSLTFPRDDGFYKELKSRVELELQNVATRDDVRMYAKTAVILAWFWTSYALLTFVASSVWVAVPLALSAGFALSCIGFSVMHDANHGAYSKYPAINRLFGLTLDMLGASSYVWHWKHNILHHTYPNITGVDDDLDVMPFARLAPGQPRRYMHRWQHWYLWFLYGMLAPKWHFIDDYKSVIRGRIADREFPRPTGWRLLELVVGKALFLTWAFVIPMQLHRWWVVLCFYLVVSLASGIIMAVTFQLAHCVGEARFFEPTGEMSNAWAVHQVETTVDGRLRAPQLGPELVPRRAQLPDRAPPLSQDLSRALRADCSRRRESRRGVRRALRGARQPRRSDRVALALAAEHGAAGRLSPFM